MTLTTRSVKGSALTHSEMDANWAHVVDSANQTFTPSGSDTSAVSVALKLMQSVSLLDYIDNAVIPHSTIRDRTVTADLLTHINNAITRMSARGGGVLTAPSGYYPHDGNIIQKSNVWIVGEGYGTHFHNTSVDGRSFQNENRDGPSITDVNIGLFNMRITNNKAGSASEHSHCVDIRYVRNFHYDKLWLDDASGDGMYLRGNENVYGGLVILMDVTRQGVSVTSGGPYKLGRFIGQGCNANNVLDIEPNASDVITDIEFDSVDVLSGTANACNIFGDDPDQILSLHFKKIKSKNLKIHGCTRVKGDMVNVAPTTDTSEALSIFECGEVTISHTDVTNASGIDQKKIKVSTCDQVDLGKITAVGPGGNTNMTMEFLSSNRVRARSVYITEGGIYPMLVKNCNDVEVDGYVVDGAGTYGFAVAPTTTNGNVSIRGIRVSGYTTGGRIEGTNGIVTLEGDIPANSLSQGANFIGLLRAQRLRGSTAPAQFGAVGNAGTGEDNLLSFTCLAGTLGRAREYVEVHAWGSYANNANAKTLKLYFGSAVISSQSLTANQVGTWEFRAVIASTSTDNQRYSARFFQEGTAEQNDLDVGTTTEDDGAAITIKCTGEATDNNDIVQNGLIVKWHH